MKINILVEFIKNRITAVLQLYYNIFILFFFYNLSDKFPIFISIYQDFLSCVFKPKNSKLFPIGVSLSSSLFKYAKQF